MNLESTYKKRLAIFICILGVFVVFASLADKKNDATTLVNGVHFDNLADVETIATSVYILDTANNQVILERNATIERPIASITKIMTAIVALDLWEKGEIVEATLPNQSPDQNVSTVVMLKENWTLGNLLKLMITKSSNEAAFAIGEHAKKKGIDFVAEMNKKAKELNLWKTSFFNESGLDLTDGFAGAYASAEDVAYLMRYAVINHPDIFESASDRGYNAISEEGTEYFVENTNRSAGALPGLVASKTGFTDLAGGNLVYVLLLENGQQLVVSLLGSTKEGRFEDAERIGKALLADYSAHEKK